MYANQRYYLKELVKAGGRQYDEVQALEHLALCLDLGKSPPNLIGLTTIDQVVAYIKVSQGRGRLIPRKGSKAAGSPLEASVD